MSFIIEKASPEDAQAVIDYLKIVGGESDNLTFGGEGLSSTPEQEMEWIKTTNSSDKNVMFVARMGDTIIGDVSLRSLSGTRISHRGEMGISVAKEYWGMGIGTALMEAVIDFALHIAKIDVLSLEVRSDNERAIALYKKFGFDKFGTYKKFFKINEEFFDADYMNLYL